MCKRVFARKPIIGYGFVAGSTVAIAALSLGVWAHHMFAVGLGHAWDYAFGASSLLIAVPTGVKVFNWIATMWGGSIRFTTAMLFNKEEKPQRHATGLRPSLAGIWPFA